MASVFQLRLKAAALQNLKASRERVREHLGTAQVAYSIVLMPAFALGSTALTVTVVLLILGVSAYAWVMLRRVYGGTAFATALRCLALLAAFLVVGSLINSLTVLVVLATV